MVIGIIIHGMMFFITFLTSVLPLVEASYKQLLVTDEVMTWTPAERVCKLLFGGIGTVHLSVDIPKDGYRHHMLRGLETGEAVWLDGIRYHFGCRSSNDVCQYLTVQHRRREKPSELKTLCTVNGSNVVPVTDCRADALYKISMVSMHGELSKVDLFMQGKELIVGQASIQGIKTMCRVATKTEHGFSISFKSCDALNKALCVKNTDNFTLVTTVKYQQSYRRNDPGVTSIVFNNTTRTDNLQLSDDKDKEHPLLLKWIGLGMSGFSCLLSLAVAIALCSRKKAEKVPERPSIYGTLSGRPMEEGYLTPAFN